ncbi:succinate dehydrogenase iron-sulfur subunit [Vulcanisaeta thermophila]|uniref:succinate dehydrogenase iron-sulfur subunit n=1 Tax=Vulcanisaeta thermophila TaxID=867917 RepID=UPI000852AEAD|nr:succinate dehydrogenase iron-sulfur subunit [Vulcanisaeta thermophila]
MPTITVRVKRFDGKTTWWQEYKVDVKGLKISVLDVLLRIKEEQDPTLAVRYSCRMAICGSCGMVINGKPRLACETLLEELETDVVTVEPMWNYRVIKDLVADTEPMLMRLREVKPYILRDTKEIFESDIEYGQKPEELNKYLNFAYCIECGLCYSACPVAASDKLFLGPMILAAAYRWSADSRDRGWPERMKIVNSDVGVWSCIVAYSCSAVCPRNVDPGFAIQQLKKAILLRRKKL